MLQLEQERLVVLEVQRLDVSQAGLLRLKLFQKAGNLLLQGLEVRQSTEVSLCLKQLSERTSNLHLPTASVSRICQLHLSPALLNCICQLYLSFAIVNCNCQLHLLNASVNWLAHLVCSTLTMHDV